MNDNHTAFLIIVILLGVLAIAALIYGAYIIFFEARKNKQQHLEAEQNLNSAYTRNKPTSNVSSKPSTNLDETNHRDTPPS